jgi:hypothetical protein
MGGEQCDSDTRDRYSLNQNKARPSISLPAFFFFVGAKRFFFILCLPNPEWENLAYNTLE